MNDANSCGSLYLKGCSFRVGIVTAAVNRKFHIATFAHYISKDKHFVYLYILNITLSYKQIQSYGYYCVGKKIRYFPQNITELSSLFSATIKE